MLTQITKFASNLVYKLYITPSLMYISFIEIKHVVPKNQVSKVATM